MKTTLFSTLADIVKNDFRSAAVLSEYKLDFCCKGGRTMKEACETRGINPIEVLARIEEVCLSSVVEENYNNQNLEELTQHIVEKHHEFVRRTAPVITAHLNKVARVHGQNHPEVVSVAHLFEKIKTDLEDHLIKEELVLFPYIRSLAADGTPPHHYPFNSVAMPVRNMMTEHEMAGEDMEEIRLLTGDYVPPEDACTTYRIAYKELEEFEADLHKHVHLENNILFPRAVELEKQYIESGRNTIASTKE